MICHDMRNSMIEVLWRYLLAKIDLAKQALSSSKKDLRPSVARKMETSHLQFVLPFSNSKDYKHLKKKVSKLPHNSFSHHKLMIHNRLQFMSEYFLSTFL